MEHLDVVTRVSVGLDPSTVLWRPVPGDPTRLVPGVSLAGDGADSTWRQDGS